MCNRRGNLSVEYTTKPQYRYLVAFTAFSEPHNTDNAWYWFLFKGHEVCFFAVFRRPWKSERLKMVPGKKRRARVMDDWELYSFLTTAPTETVKQIHEKAMPMILTNPEECREWLSGRSESFRLQSPFLDEHVTLLV